MMWGVCTSRPQATGRARGGLCHGDGLGDRAPPLACPPHRSPLPPSCHGMQRTKRPLQDERSSGRRLAVDAPGRVLVWSSGRPIHGSAPLPLFGEWLCHAEKMRTGVGQHPPRMPCAACRRRGHTPPLRLVEPSEPHMRLVLLLLMTTCVTGCVPQFPFYCEDAQASIC